MRKRKLLLCLAACLPLVAQSPSYWKQGLSGLPERPPASTSPSDVAQFERNLQLSAPYFARLQPNDYEANRALARHMAAYLAGLQLLARDPQMRQAVFRAQQTFNSLSLVPLLGYTGSFLMPAPPSMTGEPIPGDRAPMPPIVPSQPPFPLSAPVMTDLASTDKAIAADLSNRYEADAGRAAGAWQNAETLRLSLASRGMTLNTATSTSVMRLPVYFNNASESLRRRDWDDARTNLVRAETETEKIMKSVGR